MNERDKEIAKQAGMVYREFEDEFANANTDGVDQETMQKFAALIRADEREAFVAFIQSYPHWLGNKAKEEIVQAIRARGNT